MDGTDEIDTIHGTPRGDGQLAPATPVVAGAPVSTAGRA
jgi:hypothetical protein